MAVATTALGREAARIESERDFYRPGRRIPWRKIVRFAALLFFCAFWVAPVLWMALTSLKPEAQTMVTPPRWFPEKLSDFTLQNYRDVINHPRGIDIITAFKNSLIVACLGSLLTVLIDVPAGYVFARMRFPGRNFLFAVVIASLI